MDQGNNRRPHSPDELVNQYRDIGIPAVAAAARYQSRDLAGTRRRRKEDHAQEGPPAGKDKNKNAWVRRR